jgi:hypothetical protein
MMKAHVKGFVCATIALLLASHAAQAAIIKLDLGGGSGPDLVYSGAVLATPSDGDAATLGSQDTGIVYGDFLSALPNTTGSYSLHNLATNGAATVTVIGPLSLVSQPLSGGDFQLYGPAPGNVKLLDVSLASSASLLSGTLNSSTGAIISVNNGTVVGGTLAPLIDSTSISFSIALSNISGGALGLDAGNILKNFTAAATKEIGGSLGTGGGLPEPSTMVLLALGVMTGSAVQRRRS